MKSKAMRGRIEWWRPRVNGTKMTEAQQTGAI